MKKILHFHLLIGMFFTFYSSAFAQGVGVGTSTPNISSVLELSSTTKGFLPPRMTYAQRIAIPSPTAGLIMYCVDCGSYGELQIYNGTSWTNIIGDPPVPVLVVGLDYKGGKIAYIFQPGEPGYVSGQVHGIIATTLDQSASALWDDDAFVVTGATGSALGTGETNTNTIVAVEGAGNYAAKLCSDLVLNGFSDWYMPSKDELNKLYLNQIAIGGFGAFNYWCSTEFDIQAAWLQSFTNGSQNPGSKNIPAHLRPIRNF